MQRCIRSCRRHLAAFFISLQCLDALQCHFSHFFMKNITSCTVAQNVYQIISFVAYVNLPLP